MKSTRQMAILELIAKQNIETQEQLVAALQAGGMNVTQATVSRDIRELRLVKAQMPDGTSKYVSTDTAEAGLNDRLVRIMSDSVLSVAVSGNILVVHTISGSANVVGEAIDSLRWPEILGTIAGDNTILVVIRAESDSAAVQRRLQEMMK